LQTFPKVHSQQSTKRAAEPERFIPPNVSKETEMTTHQQSPRTRRLTPMTMLRIAGLLAIAAPAFSHAATAHVSCLDTFANGMCVYGSADTGAAPMRVIDLTATKRDVSVQYGETVRFVAGDRSFIWTFNGLGGRNVSLSRIAPEGFQTHGVAVEVDVDPSTQS
jgi:hypothetical protein